jgi:hypothetical protein
VQNRWSVFEALPKALFGSDYPERYTYTHLNYLKIIDLAFHYPKYMRHAPKPDEDDVEWNPDEIDMTQRPDHLAGQYKGHYGNVDVNPDNDEENQHQYMRRPGIPAKGVPEGKSPEDYGNVFWKRYRHAVTIDGEKHLAGHAIELDNRHVVPYNKFLTLKYGTHINVEYVFGEKCCKYVFKYLLKGKLFSLL